MTRHRQQNHIFGTRFGEICRRWEDHFGVLHALLTIPAAAFTSSKLYIYKQKSNEPPCCTAERLHRETAVDIGVEEQVTWNRTCAYMVACNSLFRVGFCNDLRENKRKLRAKLYVFKRISLCGRFPQTLRSESGSLMRGDHWRVLGRSVLVRQGQSLNSEAADAQMQEVQRVATPKKIERQNTTEIDGTLTCHNLSIFLAVTIMMILLMACDMIG